MAAVAAVCACRAQPVISPLVRPVTLDGISREIAWENAEPVPLIVYDPVYGDEPTEQTEIRLAYNEANLYVSGRFYDSDTGGIRANSMYRDLESGDDLFGILIDAFSDKESGRYFWTTPAGVRGDAAVSGDGGSINESWNTHWDVAAARTDEGWFIEMRIPFSSLGFQSRGGEVTLGVIAFRTIARKNERHVFPAVSEHRELLTPSQAHPIALTGVTSRKPLYVSPYALGGLEQNIESIVVGDAGLDVKYNATSNVTLDLTVNTDFAQVEADDEQINLSRFSLFFPEKRPFFQERSGLFEFGTSAFGPDRLFHSRVIGLQDGRAVPILGGARLVGRAGRWDVGFLNVQTASENFGVMRLRRQVINPYSVAGGMVTSRFGIEDDLAYGLDAVLRLFGDDYLTLKWAQTFDGHRSSNAGLAQGILERRRITGLNYGAAITWSGADFRPGIGFTTRRDFTEIGGRVSYDWRMGRRSVFRQISPLQLAGFAVLRNHDRTIESAQAEYNFDLEWKSGAEVSADLQLHYENLLEQLSFTDEAGVAPGRYTFIRVEGGYETSPGGRLRLELDGSLGGFYDGWLLGPSLTGTWNLSRFFEAGCEYEYSFVRFPDRNQVFDAHLARLRLRAALNTSISTHAFIQYNSADGTVGLNVRFRWNFSEGHDLWIVYDEGLDPFSRDTQTMLVKYTHTLVL